MGKRGGGVEWGEAMGKGEELGKGDKFRSDSEMNGVSRNAVTLPIHLRTLGVQS